MLTSLAFNSGRGLYRLMAIATVKLLRKEVLSLRISGVVSQNGS